jgi:ring-1,2-phenylacetyl-CoA epoxidase subunit PaaE
MSVKKTFGVISEIIDLTLTSKEIKIILDEELDFIPGHFVNIFMDVDGEKIRRAYSISSSKNNQKEITISMRLSSQGKMTPIFWNKNLIGEKIEIMGPLGLNTVDKMNRPNVYLFAFGIGAGVVKSLADYFCHRDDTKSLIILTGSRFENEIIYKEYFDDLAKQYSKVKSIYVVSRPENNSSFKKGYIQDHVDDFDFNHSDIYICGQESACNALIQKIKDIKPEDCDFFVESFH